MKQSAPRSRRTNPRHRSARRRSTRPLLIVATLSLGAGGFVVVAHLQSERELRTNAATFSTAPTRSTSRVLAITPLTGTQNVGWSSLISVQLSQPLTQASLLPRMTPTVAGSWSWRSTRTVVFHPKGRFAPGVTYLVTIPEATRGSVASSPSLSLSTSANATPVTTTQFSVALPSITRLQQLLAELDYLPVTFTPSTSSTASALGDEPASTSQIPLSAQNGIFAWRFSNTPSTLQALFRPGYWSVLDQAAVMSFEAAHGLSVDGVPSAPVWSALLSAIAHRQVNPRPYNYVVASESPPERLVVWSGGSIVYSTPANTGVAGAATPQGTWPVRLRFASQTMAGTNPNGAHYVDPGIRYIAYFYGSDAVHGFPRASYGFPQSAGCVEIPLAAAKIVYGLDPLGTLVTVTAKPLAS